MILFRSSFVAAVAIPGIHLLFLDLVAVVATPCSSPCPEGEFCNFDLNPLYNFCESCPVFISDCSNLGLDHPGGVNDCESSCIDQVEKAIDENTDTAAFESVGMGFCRDSKGQFPGYQFE